MSAQLRLMCVLAHPDDESLGTGGALAKYAACFAAADASYTGAENLPPHAVAKLYYMSTPRALAEAYAAVFGDIVMRIDGVDRQVVIDEDWAITTWLDTSAYEDTIWKAVFCHTSQLPTYSRLEQVPEQYRKAIWSQESYYRAFSTVNGGRAIEHDLFEGLR